MKSYKERWKAIVWEHRESYAFLAERDPFIDWDRLRAPESMADGSLQHALYMRYADDPFELYARFLDVAKARCERIACEDRFDSDLCNLFFPQNRSRFLQVSSYVNGIRSADLCLQSIGRASFDLESWCKDVCKGVWDDQTQSYYLSSIRLALIAGDMERAQKLLRVKRQFICHERNHSVMIMLASQPIGVLPIEGNERLATFDEYFDVIRDPDYNPGIFVERDMLRFEFGILREKYFVSQDGTINWDRVIDMISR